MKSVLHKMMAAGLLVLLPLLAGAQGLASLQRNEIVQSNDCEVFSVAAGEATHYYLSVGRPGMGSATVQVYLDPASEMFLPLGKTLDEAIQTLERLKALCEEKSGSTTMMEGCVAVGVPRGAMEPLEVTTRRALWNKQLELSVMRENYRRTAFLSRSEIVSLLGGVRLHRKLHPQEAAREHAEPTRQEGAEK